MLLKFQRVIQIFFLAAFVTLIAIGKVHIWMFIFLGSSIAAIILGRFYCGWVCPINTIIDGVNWFYRKLGIERRRPPRWAKSPALRYTVFLLFIGIMVLGIKTGEKFPVLPALTILGTIFTLIFIPAFWHRYLCPYGTLLNITGSLARHYWRVNENDCIKCGVCKKVCPGEAIEMEGKKDFPQINKGLCLECNICIRACPQNAIRYL